jgi:uncharacterized membrane protein YkoI
MNRTLAALILTIACGLAVASPAHAYTGEELASQAAVPLDKARAIALKAFRGVITDMELEKEKGGSGLRYTFVISKHGVQNEVGVDAMSGMLLENSPEGPNSD